jgi:hypothetical protein
MLWWNRYREHVAEKQKEAEDALIMSQVSYLDAVNMNRAAERVEQGHRKLQHENHFAEKLFGRPA